MADLQQVPPIRGDDSLARFEYIEKHGPQMFNKAMAIFHEKQAVANVNGYRIRAVMCRWGRLYTIDGLNKAYTNLDDAKSVCRMSPKGEL